MSLSKLAPDDGPLEPPAKRARVKRSLPAPPPLLPGSRDSLERLDDASLHHLLSFVPVAELFALEPVCSRWRMIILGVCRALRSLAIVASEAFFYRRVTINGVEMPPEGEIVGAQARRLARRVADRNRMVPQAQPRRRAQQRIVPARRRGPRVVNREVTYEELSKWRKYTDSEQPLDAMYDFVAKFDIPLLDARTRLLLPGQLDETARLKILTRFPNVKRLELVVNLLGRATPHIRALLIKYQKQLVHLKVITRNPDFGPDVRSPVHSARAWRHLGWSINKCRALRHLTVFDYLNRGKTGKPLTRKHLFQNLKQLEELYVDDWFQGKAFLEGIKRLSHFTKLKAFGTLSPKTIAPDKAIDGFGESYCAEVGAVMSRLDRLIVFEVTPEPKAINFIQRLPRMRSMLVQTLSSLHLKGVLVGRDDPNGVVPLVKALATLEALTELRFDYSPDMFSGFKNRHDFEGKQMPQLDKLETLHLHSASLPHGEFALACLIWPNLKCVKFDGHDSHCRTQALFYRPEHLCWMGANSSHTTSCELKLLDTLTSSLEYLKRIYFYPKLAGSALPRNTYQYQSVRQHVLKNSFGVKHTIEHVLVNSLGGRVYVETKTQHFIVDPKFKPIEMKLELELGFSEANICSQG